MNLFKKSSAPAVSAAVASAGGEVPTAARSAFTSVIRPTTTTTMTTSQSLSSAASASSTGASRGHHPHPNVSQSSVQLSVQSQETEAFHSNSSELASPSSASSTSLSPSRDRVETGGGNAFADSTLRLLLNPESVGTYSTAAHSTRCSLVVHLKQLGLQHTRLRLSLRSLHIYASSFLRCACVRNIPYG